MRRGSGRYSIAGVSELHRRFDGDPTSGPGVCRPAICRYSGRCERLLACLLARDLPAGLTYFPGSAGGGPEVSSLCGNLVV